MALNVNLFVHGVPMGQKTWGSVGDDKMYLSSFYGPKWAVPELMKVDIMAFGGFTYAYYTLVKGQNVFDSQGRAGAYFALTLRMNAYYADIQNIYNILKAAFDKFCVGSCLKEATGTYRFVHQDFMSTDQQLKALQTHLINYIGEFSVDDDIVSLAGFHLSGQSAAQNINLHECTRNVALNYARQSGKFVVSPWFLDSKSAKTVAQCKAETAAVTQRFQQELQLQQQAASEKLAAASRSANEERHRLKEQANKELEEVRLQKDQAIASLKAQYADVDAQISRYQQAASEYSRQINSLQNEAVKREKEIVNMRRRLSQLEGYGMAGQGGPTRPKGQKLPWIVTGIISFFLLLLSGLMTYFYFQDKSEIRTLKEENMELSTAKDTLLEKSGTLEVRLKALTDSTKSKVKPSDKPAVESSIEPSLNPSVRPSIKSSVQKTEKTVPTSTPIANNEKKESSEH